GNRMIIGMKTGIAFGKSYAAVCGLHKDANSSACCASPDINLSRIVRIDRYRIIVPTLAIAVAGGADRKSPRGAAISRFVNSSAARLIHIIHSNDGANFVDGKMSDNSTWIDDAGKGRSRRRSDARVCCAIGAGETEP